MALDQAKQNALKAGALMLLGPDGELMSVGDPLPVQEITGAAPVSPANPFPVMPGNGTPVDASGTCTGASQQVLAANATRKLWMVQNVDPTNTIYINDKGAATQGSGSIRLLPGQLYEPPLNTTGAINAIGPSGALFTATEYR